MKYNIVVFGTKSTTEEIIKHIDNVDLIITLSPEAVNKHHISGYKYLEPIAQDKNIQIIAFDDYSLKSHIDFFYANKFDIGIVNGWQRLIPIEVLDRFKYGIFGFHGSPSNLPCGKGRSPMNWALINGESEIKYHCIKYSEEADEGQIFDVNTFDITPQDDIFSLQLKGLLSAKLQIDKLLKAYKSNDFCLKPQRGVPSFFKKRSPEDGLIDFNCNTEDIFNLIRGVSEPFPGAFFFSENYKITVWSAQPFNDVLPFNNYEPGDAIYSREDSLLIKTRDGAILLRGFEIKPKKSNVGIKSHQF